MLKPNTKIGRRRKVFKKGKAHISFTGKSVTTNAATTAVSRILDVFNIPDQFGAIITVLDKGNKHPTRVLLQQLITLRILYGDAISDRYIE